MNSTFIHQKANELVLRAGSRDLRTIAKTVGMDVTEMPFDAISGFFTFKWDLYQVVINVALDRQTKQMVCGYALSRYAETYLFPDKVSHSMNFISPAHLVEYEANAFSSHLMLDSEEVYHLTKLGYDVQQIAAMTKRHLHTILVKLLALYHMGYDMTHYYSLHSEFLQAHQELAHFSFCP